MDTKNRLTWFFRNFEFWAVFREFDIFVSSHGIYTSWFPYEYMTVWCINPIRWHENIKLTKNIWKLKISQNTRWPIFCIHHAVLCANFQLWTLNLGICDFRWTFSWRLESLLQGRGGARPWFWNPSFVHFWNLGLTLPPGQNTSGNTDQGYNK